MKISILLSLILISSPSFSKERIGAYQSFRNIIRPFTSDGCSQFPDSMIGMDYEECCLQHDYAYWRGGTSQERTDADAALGACVGSSAFSALGTMMELGVTFGGAAPLPTTWRWGYGWVINRGYAPLSAELVAYADDIFASRDKDAELISPGILQNKDKVTGDYCLDMALDYISKELEIEGLEFSILEDIRGTSAQGDTRTLKILTPECSNSINIDFLLLRRSACTDKMGELLSRGRIRMQRRRIKCESFDSSLPF
jgi:hypothetical protein